MSSQNIQSFPLQSSRWSSLMIPTNGELIYVLFPWDVLGTKYLWGKVSHQHIQADQGWPSSHKMHHLFENIGIKVIYPLNISMLAAIFKLLSTDCISKLHICSLQLKYYGEWSDREGLITVLFAWNALGPR